MTALLIFLASLALWFGVVGLVVAGAWLLAAYANRREDRLDLQAAMADATAAAATEDDNLRRSALRALTPEDRAILDGMGWTPPRWLIQEETNRYWEEHRLQSLGRRVHADPAVDAYLGSVARRPSPRHPR